MPYIIFLDKCTDHLLELEVHNFNQFKVDVSNETCDFQNTMCGYTSINSEDTRNTFLRLKTRLKE